MNADVHTMDGDIAEILDLARPPRATRVLARILAILFVFVVGALIVVPWQQTSVGKGRATAYAPIDRQQNLDAPVEGRVTRWFVQEGDHVKAGDPIVDLSDNDPEIIVRLKQERDAQNARIVAAKARIEAAENRIGALDTSRVAAGSAAESRVSMARDRVRGAQQSLDAAEMALKTAQLNADRQAGLHAEGLASKRALELAELDLVKARTEVDRYRAVLNAARTEEAALRADQAKIGSDATASVSSASETLAGAQSEIASATAELARIEVRLARQLTQHVTAPRAGIVFRVMAKNQGGQYVKAGETLAVLVPDTTDRAVELWVDGNDAPLIWEGRQVRLQFEGWPAVQWVGWPSIAIGTFGGKVAFVDPTDDGKGNFRVVVVPDGRDPWPSPRYLRQGTRVNGWVLLGVVRLGYEAWRQFNGFPPAIPTKDMLSEPSSEGGGKK
jgi:adhesin transport system membrane fusion protein